MHIGSQMRAALLADRGVVKLAGEDARSFLNGLLTADMGRVSPQAARYAALLTPQGKIIADFIVVEADAADGGGFLLDCPRALASELARRLGFYKLRARVTVEDRSDALGVVAAWDGDVTGRPVLKGLAYADPRLPALGLRMILPPALAPEAAAELGATLVDAAAYEAHRIALAIPRGGADFAYGDAFPHEAGMDQLAGVDFDKGCYVGQEVVSRTQHRGSARTRVAAIRFSDGAPEPGTPVMAADKTIGQMGSGADGHGVALIRLDRLQDALDAGAALSAGGIALQAAKPAWARYAFPGDGAAEKDRFNVPSHMA